MSLLKKSINGPKFSKVVIKYGLRRCRMNNSVFTRYGTDGHIILAIYADEIVITENDENGIDGLKKKNLGNLQYFLGVELAKSSIGMY